MTSQDNTATSGIDYMQLVYNIAIGIIIIMVISLLTMLMGLINKGQQTLNQIGRAAQNVEDLTIRTYSTLENLDNTAKDIQELTKATHETLSTINHVVNSIERKIPNLNPWNSKSDSPRPQGHTQANPN